MSRIRHIRLANGPFQRPRPPPTPSAGLRDDTRVCTTRSSRTLHTHPTHRRDKTCKSSQKAPYTPRNLRYNPLSSGGEPHRCIKKVNISTHRRLSPQALLLCISTTKIYRKSVYLCVFSELIQRQPCPLPTPPWPSSLICSTDVDGITRDSSTHRPRGLSRSPQTTT